MQEESSSDEELSMEQNVDSIEEGEMQDSTNNNVTQIGCHRGMTSDASKEGHGCKGQQHCSQDGQSDGNKVATLNQKTEHNEEEEGMQRFVDYIKKQGLVIVDGTTLQNSSKKTNKQGGKKSDQGESESIVTIYQQAVNKETLPDKVEISLNNISEPN